LSRKDGNSCRRCGRLRARSGGPATGGAFIRRSTRPRRHAGRQTSPWMHPEGSERRREGNKPGLACLLRSPLAFRLRRRPRARGHLLRPPPCRTVSCSRVRARTTNSLRRATCSEARARGDGESHPARRFMLLARCRPSFRSRECRCGIPGTAKPRGSGGRLLGSGVSARSSDKGGERDGVSPPRRRGDHVGRERPSDRERRGKGWLHSPGPPPEGAHCPCSLARAKRSVRNRVLTHDELRDIC